MGVSATHLDWTMVPYVRKSFRKHYRDGRKYIYADGPIIKGLDDEVTLAEDDFSITNPIFEEYYPKAYQYAMDMTKRELNQAVEGMYHNLK